jgi:hypothetical protein
MAPDDSPDTVIEERYFIIAPASGSPEHSIEPIYWLDSTGEQVSRHDDMFLAGDGERTYRRYPHPINPILEQPPPSS